MDLWGWVMRAGDDLRRNGNLRLAKLIEEMPGCAVGDEHARVDAMYPEALALAKQTRNPWLEIFVRHWYLQSKVICRMDARVLPDAVALVELAHRPEHQACPQSVCTTQDLANCYASADGPGYAEERLALARETLSRIGPEWPCFSCITNECADALNDAGKAEETLRFLDAQEQALIQCGDPVRQRPRLLSERIAALRLLGRLEEAEKVATRAIASLAEDSDYRRLRAMRARVRAELGWGPLAEEDLEPFQAIHGTLRLYSDWGAALTRLVLDGHVENTWSIGRSLAALQRGQTEHGVVREAIAMALRRVELAVAREATTTAQQALAEARALVGKLRRPLDAPERIAAAAVQVAGMARPTLPASPDAVLSRLGDDPERDLDVLIVAVGRWPEHAHLAMAYANAWRIIGSPERGVSHLAEWLDERLDAEVYATHAELLLALDRFEEVVERAEALIAGADADLATWAHWMAARALRELGRNDACQQHLEAVVHSDPGAMNSRRMLADLLLHEGRPEQGLPYLDEVVAAEGPGPWDWERMVLATLAGDWARVRHSAARVGMQLEGEGPIDDAWGPVILRFTEDDGSSDDRYAMRTGPVTARVIQIAAPGSRPHYMDDVVFDATPIAPPDEADPDRPHTFRAVKVLRPGRFEVFAIDGFHPGDEALDAIHDAIGMEMHLQVVSNDEYQIWDAEADTMRRGLFAFLAIRGISLSAASDRLAGATSALPRPWLWPELARRAGQAGRASEHEGLAARYGIRIG